MNLNLDSIRSASSHLSEDGLWKAPVVRVKTFCRAELAEGSRELSLHSRPPARGGLNCDGGSIRLSSGALDSSTYVKHRTAAHTPSLHHRECDTLKVFLKNS